MTASSLPAAHPALLTHDLDRAIAEDLAAYGVARIEGPVSVVNRVTIAIDRAARLARVKATWARTGHGWTVRAYTA